MPSGARVTVEGTPEEVEELVGRIQGERRKRQERPAKDAASKEGKAIRDYILELREAGVFKKAQGLTDVKNALHAEGHIIPITTLSGVMLELVKSKQLRRFKDQKTWKYVNR